ncbi:unknown [Eubacterium sp. CAG:156]|jgi:hypothetical protein|nr:unknown [Eubacterium sp. CAG:156]
MALSRKNELVKIDSENIEEMVEKWRKELFINLWE